MKVLQNPCRTRDHEKRQTTDRQRRKRRHRSTEQKDEKCRNERHKRDCHPPRKSSVTARWRRRLCARVYRGNTSVKPAPLHSGARSVAPDLLPRHRLFAPGARPRKAARAQRGRITFETQRAGDARRLPWMLALRQGFSRVCARGRASRRCCRWRRGSLRLAEDGRIPDPRQAPTRLIIWSLRAISSSCSAVC